MSNRALPMVLGMISAVICLIAAIVISNGHTAQANNTNTTTQIIQEDSATLMPMFMIVGQSPDGSYKVAYHKETKVMYAISNDNYAIFTVLLDANGQPLLWEN